MGEGRLPRGFSWNIGSFISCNLFCMPPATLIHSDLNQSSSFSRMVSCCMASNFGTARIFLDPRWLTKRNVLTYLPKAKQVSTTVAAWLRRLWPNCNSSLTRCSQGPPQGIGCRKLFGALSLALPLLISNPRRATVHMHRVPECSARDRSQSPSMSWYFAMNSLRVMAHAHPAWLVNASHRSCWTSRSSSWFPRRILTCDQISKVQPFGDEFAVCKRSF